jgi:NADH-quinone oxidoreductase subunit I
MGYFLDSLRSLGTSMRNAFRTPTTVQFPKEIRERSERYRTSFALLHDSEDDELCVGCLQCERICPSQVITVIAEKKESPVTGKRRGYAKDFVLDLNACIFCELCVQVCPTDAIVMTRVAETPGYSREALCLTMDRLYENETEKPATWATASLLMGMQDPKRGQPDAKAAKKAARAEAKADKPKAEPKADKPKAEAKPKVEPEAATTGSEPKAGKPGTTKPVDPTRTTSKETPDSKAGPEAADSAGADSGTAKPTTEGRTE